MKTQSLCNIDIALPPFFGRFANKATHKLTGTVRTSTVATTHDHKEVTMNTQRNHTSNVSLQPFFGQSPTLQATTPARIRMFAVLCSFLIFLASAPATWGTSQCGTPNPAGGRYCVSPQYRFSPELTGAPSVDVLGTGNLNNLYLKFSRATNTGGAPLPPAGPNSSPSVITRAIFASQDDNGNWGLWSYNAPGGGSFGWDTVTKNPTLSIAYPIRSSPGYPGKNAEPYVYAGGEDGNLYAFGYTTGTLGWTYTTNDAIDASPTVSDANEVYIINASGYIYKVDGYSGTSIWPAIASGVLPGSGTTSASSLSLSDVSCSGSCTWLFAAGTSPSNTGVVKAFDSVTGSSLAKWTASLPQPVTSSPVVSKPDQLVYVQSRFDYYNGFDGKEIYALDELTGNVLWSALPPQVPKPPALPPCPNVVGHYLSGGSPAYDQATETVFASLEVIYDYSSCGTVFKNSILTAYDATRGHNGTVKWSVVISNPISQSSPTVANGVVYIGTDDGYILAFDESNGNPLWTSPKLDSGVFSPPVVGINRIYVVTNLGTLDVFGLPGY